MGVAWVGECGMWVGGSRRDGCGKWVGVASIGHWNEKMLCYFREEMNLPQE